MKDKLTPARVCAAIRQWKRAGVRMSYMDQDALRFAHDMGLIAENHWPTTTCHITPDGLNYLIEHEEGGDE